MIWLFIFIIMIVGKVICLKKWGQWFFLSISFVLFVAASDFFGTWDRSIDAQQAGIAEIKSSQDINGNGIDDAHDLVLGARAYVKSQPRYGSRYYAGGYPDDGYGVCTDVVVAAFDEAGYCLKDLIDEDIALDPSLYGITVPDGNIDFRRVNNQQTFFERHALSLTIECNDPADWQPGDIVIYPQHIGIVSDRRNQQGYPYLIHFDSWGARERDELTNQTIVAHYRWP